MQLPSTQPISPMKENCTPTYNGMEKEGENRRSVSLDTQEHFNKIEEVLDNQKNIMEKHEQHFRRLGELIETVCKNQETLINSKWYIHIGI